MVLVLSIGVLTLLFGLFELLPLVSTICDELKKQNEYTHERNKLLDKQNEILNETNRILKR